MRGWVALTAVLAYPIATLLPFEGGVQVRVAQVGYAMSGIGWLGLILLGGSETKVGRAGGGVPWWAILLVGLAARGLLWPHPVSDDVHRYLWEGRVTLAGGNPYVLAPNDPALAPLRDRHFLQLNHPEHAAIYGPLAELTLAGTVRIAYTPTAFKLLAIGLDLATAGVLLAWLRRTQRSPTLVLVYFLCPAVLASFAAEAHLDALLVFGLAAVLATLAERDAGTVTPLVAAASGVGLALAIGSKWVPVVLLPWWLVRLGMSGEGANCPWHRRAARVLAGMIGLVVPLGAAVAIFADHGLDAIIGPLRYFSTEFHTLDLVRQQLLRLFPPDVVRRVSVIGVGGVALIAAVMRWRAAAAQRWVLGLLLLLAPTIHMWYATWLIPSLLAAGRGRLAWLVLPVTLVFGREGDYQRAVTGSWAQPTWVAWAVWGPVLLALIWDGGQAVWTRLKGNQR